jgi:hypothetical protein
MCMGGPKPPPPLPPPKVVEPATPMASPEAGPVNSTTAAGLRKAKGRNGLKIDLSSDIGTGLSIPL